MPQQASIRQEMVVESGGKIMYIRLGFEEGMFAPCTTIRVSGGLDGKRWETIQWWKDSGEN